MKLVYNIKLSVFAKPEEDFIVIKQKLVSLFPFNLEQEKIKIKEQSAAGFNERTILVFEVLLENKIISTGF